MNDVLSKLTEDQARIALQIADRAQAMGIDPRLAVALAYQESRFNPEAKGSKGEIGLMQVMPKTGEQLGFSADDLKDPNKNIEAGLKYLKMALDKHKDPVLAAAAYNAGIDHPYFTNPDKDLPASTIKYLESIRDVGGFTAEAPKEEAPAEVTPPSEGDFQAQKTRMVVDLMGAGAGAAAAKGLDIGKNIAQTGQAIRELPGAIRGGGLPAVPMAPPGAPMAPPGAPMGAPMGAPVAGGPAGPVGGPAAPAGGPPSVVRQGGPGTFNYGKAFGLTDIEAGRALDMSKQPGGAQDLVSQRAQALQRIQQMGGGFAENPRYGGLMTPQGSAGAGPRASFVQSPGGLSQIPTPQPVPTGPAPTGPQPPGALSRAAGATGRAAGAVLGSPVVSGALGGLSMAEQGQEFMERKQAGDVPGMAISGAGVAGGALQLVPNPAVKALGATISAASPLTMYLYDKLRTQPPAGEPTPEELEQVSRPTFMDQRPRYYPSMR